MMHSRLLLSLCLLTLSTPLLAEITRGPYLQMATPGSVTLVWRSRSEMKPAVKYGTSPEQLDQVLPGDGITVRRTAAEGGGGEGKAAPLFAAPPETRQYSAVVSGLKPGTRYYYSIADGETAATAPGPEFYFETAPEPGAATSHVLWVVGDSGTGNKAQSGIHTAMRHLLEKEKKSLTGYLHVGDMAYGSGLDSEFQGFFFEPYAATLRNTVCWPVLGNHEGRTSRSATATGPYYDAYVVPQQGEAGGVPSGTEAYYSFDLGDAHFIGLNSFDISRQANAAMAQWLKADLEKTKAAWVIAFFHHPPYTKGSHDSDNRVKGFEMVEMREIIMPILESGGVDIVLNGHSHIYERSMLIDGAYSTPTVAANAVFDDKEGTYTKSEGITPNNGTIAIVAGHGGAALSNQEAPHPVMRKSIVDYGSLLLEIKDGVLQGRMINVEGAVVDHFSLTKKGKVTQTRIAAPAAPDPFTGKHVKKSKRPAEEGSAMPQHFTAIIPKGAEWQYLGGSTPSEGWATGLDDKSGAWKTGPAGFGYSDNDDVTKLEDMKGKYSYVCIRKGFDLPEDIDPARLGLGIRYDDGFIAYLNGKEVARVNVESGSTAAAKGVTPHEATAKFRYFPLGGAAAQLKKTGNVIALEIHNDDLGSSDLTADPFLFYTIPAPAAAGEPDSSDP